MSKSIHHSSFKALETKVNDQIAMELFASNTYLQMHGHCAHDSVSFPGLAKFFKKSYEEEREHADKLVNYSIMRGGSVKIAQIPAPKPVPECVIEMLKTVIELENSVSNSLQQLLEATEKQNDHEFADYLIQEYVREQHEALAQLSNMLTQLERAAKGGPLGIYIWDKELLKTLA